MVEFADYLDNADLAELTLRTRIFTRYSRLPEITQNWRGVGRRVVCL
jgi:hypothetical protein